MRASLPPGVPRRAIGAQVDPVTGQHATEKKPAQPQPRNHFRALMRVGENHAATASRSANIFAEALAAGAGFNRAAGLALGVDDFSKPPSFNTPGQRFAGMLAACFALMDRAAANGFKILVTGDPLKKIEALAAITHVVRAGEVFDPKVLLARARQARGN